MISNLIPFLQFPPEIRKVTYTTNAIGSPNMVMRKYTRNRRIYPSDDSALMSLYVAIREASKRWRSVHHWKPALQVFQLLFGEGRVLNRKPTYQNREDRQPVQAG